jgi:hypothetical protein
MKLKLYLDTSVFSAYLDDRAPDRRAQTVEFWERRRRLLRLVDGLTVHLVTEEMRQLSDRYVQAGVFTAIMMNDAVHVAAAVLTRQDILLSWNFKHLVNRVRRAKVNQVNISQGLPTIEIIAPPEI